MQTQFSEKRVCCTQTLPKHLRSRGTLSQKTQKSFENIVICSLRDHKLYQTVLMLGENTFSVRYISAVRRKWVHLHQKPPSNLKLIREPCGENSCSEVPLLPSSPLFPVHPFLSLPLCIFLFPQPPFLSTCILNFLSPHLSLSLSLSPCSLCLY